MSDDFLVTHVCSADDCNHVWLYPNVFDHACPACGTTKPPISIDTLAGRREKAAKGEQLDPIVMVPDKDSEMLEQFTEGVQELRQLIEKTAMGAVFLLDTTEALENEALSALGQGYDEADEKQHIRHLYESAKGLRNLYARLRVVERQISGLFVLGDSAEHYPSGLDESGRHLIDRADASTFADRYHQINHPPLVHGAACPACPGTLKMMGHKRAGQVYLVCGTCGIHYAEGDAQPLARPNAEYRRDPYTGQVVGTGPPIDSVDTQQYGEAVHQHIGERLDETIESQLRGTNTSRLEDNVERLRKSGIEAYKMITEDGK